MEAKDRFIRTNVEIFLQLPIKLIMMERDSAYSVLIKLFQLSYSDYKTDSFYSFWIVI
jgi:hypothetical protein